MLLGFGGVLLIMRPTSLGAFDLPTAVALCAALLTALAALLMKRIGPSQSVPTIMAWTAVCGLLVCAIPAALTWRTPTPSAMLLMAVMGMFTMLNQFCWMRSMQLGRATVMASIENVRLVFAVPIGLVFFAEFPSALTYVGMVLVVIATLVITWRSRAPRQQAEELEI